MVVFVVVMRSVVSGQVSNPGVLAVIGGISVLIVAASVVCSVIALSGISSQGKKGLLWPGVVGLVISGGLGLLFLTGAINGYKKVMANREGLRQMSAASHDLIKKSGASFNPTNGIDNRANLQKIEQFRNTLNTLSNQLSGDDAQMLQALNACMSRWAAAEKDFVAAAENFQHAGVLDFARLGTPEELAEHRQAVRAFSTANETLRTSVLNQGRDLETELRSRPISERNRNNFITGFNSGRAPLIQHVQQIRDCDRDVCQNCLRLYDLLETNAGHWQLNARTKKILFDDDTAQSSANELLHAIAALGKKEVQLQRETIQIQNQAANRQRN